MVAWTCSENPAHAIWSATTQTRCGSYRWRCLDSLAALVVARRVVDQEAAARVDPRDMFKNGPYKAFDADGVPTQNDKGEPLPKSQFKKLKKQWEAQKKAFEKANAK